MYSVQKYELTDPKQVYVSIYTTGNEIEVYLENDQKGLTKVEICTIPEAIELADHMGVNLRFE